MPTEMPVPRQLAYQRTGGSRVLSKASLEINGSDTLPVVVGMCQGQVGQKAGPVPNEMLEAFRECFLQNGFSSSVLAEPPWTRHEKTKRYGPWEGILSWGVHGYDRVPGLCCKAEGHCWL